MSKMISSWNIKTYCIICFLSLMVLGCAKKESSLSEADKDWPVYLGGKSSNQYSPLNQINKENISRLKLAWEYKSGELDTNNLSQIQCNPIIIDGILYGTSPGLTLFALDAATGKQIWQFDADINENFSIHVNRGISYWQDGKDKRLFFSAGSNLYGVDAMSGKLVETFGNSGIVSLKEGLGERSEKGYVVSRTPGIIYKDLLIIGSTVSETMGAASGHIRAFNTRSGKLEWVFHTIPKPGEYGYDTWPEDAYKTIGGANNWSGMSLDAERGIVFCPTGSAAYDFWGGNRKGSNLFANSLLALKADTGERLWHYQTVHHDIWDKDLPAPPNLIQVIKDGKKVDAVAQITKQGYIFLFDRDSGENLFPIDEIPVPVSDLEGEEAWPTQPVPRMPPSLVPQIFDADMVTDIDSVSKQYVSNILKKVRTGKSYIPPSTKGTVIFPGFDGGAEWGGAAADADKGILYVNSNIMPWILMMLPLNQGEEKQLKQGEYEYMVNCAVCHGQDRQGDPSGTFPKLVGISEKYPENDMLQIVLQGKGFMPSFKHLPKDKLDKIVGFVRGAENQVSHIPDSNTEESPAVPYTHNGYNRFYDDKGYPAVKPPWGTLSAVDMNKGEILWQVPLGEVPELSDRGIPKTGTENYGGPVVTAGGIIFIGASKDECFRVFDKDSGAELWKYKLPAGGYATPSTYMIEGKQYVVIACGGGKMGTPSGSSYLAFTLE